MIIGDKDRRAFLEALDELLTAHRLDLHVGTASDILAVYLGECLDTLAFATESRDVAMRDLARRKQIDMSCTKSALRLVSPVVTKKKRSR